MLAKRKIGGGFLALSNHIAILVRPDELLDVSRQQRPGRGEVDARLRRTGCGIGHDIVAGIGHGARLTGADIHILEHFLVAAIITGQAVAIEFRLGAEAIEIVVESGEIGFGGDAVVVRIDGDQADGAIAAVGAA
ncbi:hypothetical protein D3C72_2039150 [compost metagenome]